MEQEVIVAPVEGGDIPAVIPAEPTIQEVVDGNVPEVTPVVEAPVIPAEGVTPASEVDPLINQEKVQEKINKVIAEKYKEQRRADELQSKLDALEIAKPALPTSAPDLEDFDYDEDKHNDANIQYQINKALEAQKEVQSQQQVTQAKEQLVNDFSTKEAEYISVHPEYAEEVSNLPRFNEDTLNTIFQMGPQVSHYLAKHLDVAGEVANLSPTMAAVKLGQISMGLSADNKTVTPSQAPAPVSTIAGGAAVNKDMSDMSMDEIMGLP